MLGYCLFDIDRIFVAKILLMLVCCLFDRERRPYSLYLTSIFLFWNEVSFVDTHIMMLLI